MSEFGTGCTYCLGLFLAHAERGRGKDLMERPMWPSMWFNAASDHLYELQIPELASEELKTRLEELQDKSLEWGHGSGLLSGDVTEEDVDWAIKEAKELLMLIDEELIKVTTEEAEWS